MKLSPQEKAARKAAFRAMSPAQKLEHIYLYYKWPILLGLIALVILGSVVHRQLTAREPALYLGLVNVSEGEDLERALGDDYLRAVGLDPERQEVFLYKDLYLSEDPSLENQQYAYASRMKLMGAVSAGNLDLVLMNRESWDLLSRSGYLLELPPLLAREPALEAALAPLLAENEVILSNNTIEYQLREADALEIETEPAVNALTVNTLPLFAEAGFPKEVYVGVIANSPRLEAVLQYLRYLSA